MLLSETLTNLDFYQNILEVALKTLGQPASLSVGLELVDKDEIRAVNNEHRGVDRATDVLSFPTLSLAAGEIADPERFPFDVDPETNELYLGDVLICDEVALEQAAEYGHSVERERGYLFVHAILHLLGYDHMTDEDKPVMRAQEERILSALRLQREE